MPVSASLNTVVQGVRNAWAALSSGDSGDVPQGDLHSQLMDSTFMSTFMMGTMGQLAASLDVSDPATDDDAGAPDGGKPSSGVTGPTVSSFGKASSVGAVQGSAPQQAPARATPTAEQQQLIDGNGTAMPAADAKPPAGMTAEEIGKLGGGVLDKMGDTDLQGKGGMKTLLAQRCGGKDADSIKTDPAVAWRAYLTTMAVKNRDVGDGKAQSGGDRFSGEINGFFKDHSQGGKLNADHGTDAGAMQDLLLHGEVPPPAKDIGQPPAPGTTQGQQLAIDGNTTDLPAAGEKAPPGLSPSDIAKLNSGLLGSLGGQSVTIDGQSMSLRAGLVLRYGDDAEKDAVKNAKTPEEKDAAARKALNNNPDTAWRAYRALVAVKNERRNDDNLKQDSTRHTGQIGGYTKAGDDGLAPSGSEAGSLQDLLQSGRVPTKMDKPSKWTDEEGQGQSESQVAMKEFKDFGWKILTAGLAVVVAPVMAAVAPAIGGVVGAVAGAVEGGIEGGVAGGVSSAVGSAVEGGIEGGVAGAEAGTAAAEGGAAGAEGGAAGAEGGAAGAEGASMTSNTIRGVAQQISKQTGGKLTEAQAEQAVKSLLKEAAKQGLKFGKGELKDYVEQQVEAMAGTPQQPAPDAPGPMAWDQPRAMAAAAG